MSKATEHDELLNEAWLFWFDVNLGSSITINIARDVRCNTCGGQVKICFSSCSTPHEHNRACLGVLLHRSISILSLCEDNLSLVNPIRRLSGMYECFWLYNGCTESSGCSSLNLIDLLPVSIETSFCSLANPLSL